MNPIRARVAAGEPAFGCFCTIDSPYIAELLAKAGFTWVALDMQHGLITPASLSTMIQAVELGGAVAVVRVPWNEPAGIMRALDCGAAGVIVPMVEDAEQAAAALSATRYAPAGTRSYGPARVKYAGVDEANADVLCWPMLETERGLQNLESIVAVPGLDGLFVGPADLSLSRGRGLDLTLQHPAVMEEIGNIVTAAGGHGLHVVTVAASEGHAAALAGLGVKVISFGSDKGFVSRGAQQAFAAVTPGGGA